jgi:predicted transcriptional regulator
MKTDLSRLRAEYQRLLRELARTGWISHGYVQDRGPGAGGPCYQWTRKERKKTVSVALSKEQYLGMKEAIDNWRSIQQTLKRMEQISRTVLFTTVPGPMRRKPLSKTVLGLN